MKCSYHQMDVLCPKPKTWHRCTGLCLFGSQMWAFRIKYNYSRCKFICLCFCLFAIYIDAKRCSVIIKKIVTPPAYTMFIAWSFVDSSSSSAGWDTLSIAGMCIIQKGRSFVGKREMKLVLKNFFVFLNHTANPKRQTKYHTHTQNACKSSSRLMQICSATRGMPKWKLLVISIGSKKSVVFAPAFIKLRMKMVCTYGHLYHRQLVNGCTRSKQNTHNRMKQTRDVVLIKTEMHTPYWWGFSHTHGNIMHAVAQNG